MDDKMLSVHLADCLNYQFLNHTSPEADVWSNCSFEEMADYLGVVNNQSLQIHTVDMINHPFCRGLVIVLYSIVIILGALLNTLVVATVIKTKQMWNATNIFIANLATADIFVCVFDLPLSLYQAVTQTWIFGRTLCHVIPMTFGVVVYTSTLTLTVIAIDRFILIVFPLKKRMTVTVAMLLVVVIALVAMAVASPIAIFSTYESHHYPEFNVHTTICREKWPSAQHRRIYTIVTVVAQFFLPLVLILCLYVLIFKTLRNRMQKRSSRKTKTTRMLVAVVLVFALTWTPFHLYAIIMDFKHEIVPGQYIRLIDALLKIFALSSSCINPFLYGWMNDNYRNAFLSIIKKPTATPVNIHREDSDDMSKAKHSNNAAPAAPLKQLYQKISPSTGTSKASATENKTKDEAVPLQDSKSSENTSGQKEKQVVVTMENGHCHASVQTPLLQ